MFYFGTNLKMNQTPAEASTFVAQLSQYQKTNDTSVTQLWIIPSYTNLTTVAETCARAGMRTSDCRRISTMRRSADCRTRSVRS